CGRARHALVATHPQRSKQRASAAVSCSRCAHGAQQRHGLPDVARSLISRVRISTLTAQRIDTRWLPMLNKEHRSTRTSRILGAACMLWLAACSDWTLFIPRSPQQGPGTIPDEAACTPKPPAQPAKHCASAGDVDSELPACNEWVKVQPEGAVCSN